VPSTRIVTSPGLSTIINTRYVSFSLYPIHYLSRIYEIPVTYNLLSFRAIMDLAEKFEGITCEMTISVTELDLNRKYRILRAKRPTTRFGPTVVLTIRGKGQPRPKYSCLGDIVMSLRTPILNRLIPMLCSFIWSTTAYVQLRKPTCWQ